MKREQRPQGFVAASAAQFRLDHAAGDYAPSNETEDDADEKADLCPHDRSSDEAAFISSIAIECLRVFTQPRPLSEMDCRSDRKHYNDRIMAARG